MLCRSRLPPRKAATLPRPGSRHSLPLPKQETLPQANASALTYYTDFRNERKTNREQQIAWLDSIINDEKSDEDSIKEANEKKLALINTMETEANTEGLIKAKGFSECIVTIQDETANVVVENTEALTSAQAAQIMDIVREQTGVKSENIKIMPRK